MNGGNRDSFSEVPAVSVVMTIHKAAAGVSAINRLRTLEHSVRIQLRGTQSVVLHVLGAVQPKDMLRNSIPIALTAPRSAVLNVLKGIAPGQTSVVSAMISLRGSRPVGDGG